MGHVTTSAENLPRDPALLSPLTLGESTAPNRVMFGPHVTNLARGRVLSERHSAYYESRARGGCGVIVTEELTVHASDWPYERAPAAIDSDEGLANVVTAVKGHGSLLIAALGHTGLQGSSAYSQRELWAPSPVPDAATREIPKEMETTDIEAVIDGFRRAANVVRAGGADGVEINAGQHSLIRQFLSGLTNQRTDEYGDDRLLFARKVIDAVREAVGNKVVGLRLCCDEYAPWAGITPESATDIAIALAPVVDYLVVTTGSIYSTGATRPDGHVPPGFSIDLATSIKEAVGEATSVFAQGSIVDPSMAEAAIASGLDGVEMTRAQIADPDLVRKVGSGERVRPCVLCNQLCMCRDARNPIVSCVVEPSSGHETEDPDWYGVAQPRLITVVGAGPAGMEAARVAALRGHDVRLIETTSRCGGSLASVARLPGRHRFADFAAWLEREIRHLDVVVDLETHAVGDLESAIICVGSRPGSPDFAIDDGATVLTPAQVLDGTDIVEGPVVVWDPLGAWEGTGVAELLSTSHPVTVVTPDFVVGRDLARTGDLAPANVRLHSAGVTLVKAARLRRVTRDHVEIEHRYGNTSETLPAVAVVNADHRLPGEIPAGLENHARAGDCVAPRTVAEAILEARRAVLELEER
ncbi:MAG: mycofactocin system FadH/OYE family oxidoreductase 1 [Actinobacteria bacterium]|nr:mycofactocin system FadH/OYE family oxidoreductase 1 [Actinomycetota bacterium]